MHKNLYKSFWGVCLICASLTACAIGELNLHGKSAEDVFRDPGVVQLLKAAIRQDEPEAKRLIASGVNINALGDEGITPVMWVFYVRDLKAMQMLLDLGADPDKYVRGKSGATDLFDPLSWVAAGSGQKEALELLLEHGANPNLIFGNKSPLVMAVQEGHLDCAELLLKHGADINYFNGPLNVFFATMTRSEFGNALWTLNHGYTHDLRTARRLVDFTNPRLGQEVLKEQTLEMIDQLIAAQQQK